MDRLFLASLFVSGFLTHSLSTSVKEICVTPVCNCSHDQVNNVTVTCHTKDLKNDLRSFIKNPRLIIALTVIDDNITIIPKESFVQFSNLKYLEVKIKYLKIWKGNLSREVPSLEAISVVTQNAFIPPEHILQSPRLQNITDVTWSHACTNCILLKNETHPNVTQMRNGTYDIYPPLHCRGHRYVVGHVSRTFATYGFLPMCILDNIQCFDSEVTITPMHQCWESANSVLYVEYVLAPLIIIFNIVVFTSTLTSKTLRKVPSMLLVANLAVSDSLVGVYTLSITSSRHALSYQSFHVKMNRLCPLFGFLWCCGQMAAVLSSVLLTTERYIAIIFSMRPEVSFKSKSCMYSVLVSWIVTVMVASLPFLGMGTYTSTTFCLPIQPNKGMMSFAYSAGLVALAFLLYTITLPMYAHIFLFVKKSGNQMGIKRDGRIAKKILILVVSNLVFFLLPVFIGLLWLFAGKCFKSISLSTREILVGSFTTLCLSINSFLNPLLYAFRDRRFRFVIKQRYDGIMHPNAVRPPNLSYHSAVNGRTRDVEISQVVRMKNRVVRPNAVQPPNASYQSEVDSTRDMSEMTAVRGK